MSGINNSSAIKIKVDGWMRNRETGEAVQVTETDDFMTRYANANCDGEVQTQYLPEVFELLDGVPEDADPA